MPRRFHDARALRDDVERYLQAVDLRRCNMDTLADHMSTSVRTMRRALDEAGISWGQLKTQERLRRLSHALNTIDVDKPREIAESCGFIGECSFYDFFRAHYGENFLQWRMRKKESDRRRA